MAAAVNPDLARERKAATFDVNELSDFLYFGKEKNARRKQLVAEALKEDAYKSPEHAFLSRDEQYSDAYRKSVHSMIKVRQLGLSEEEKYAYKSVVLPNEINPFGLHLSMFINTVQNQTTDEQRAKWLPLVESFKLIGTYAQTEMGHGTNLRSLETTATYDPSTEEFVVHSPTTSSMKWWPGGLGKTTNCCVVMAQLITKGRNHGMHAFLVPTRDINTHQPLPGITIGDIGPKLGYNTIDNGFLKMDRVRIPRENMFMKYAEVTKDGTYTAKASPKLTYGVMIMIRSSIVTHVADGLAQAVTIAIRYSAVRHQSELKPGAPEPQILDYQAQQYKLLPNLAAALAFWFSGAQMMRMYANIAKEIRAGNTENLPELHALSAGLKAFSSWGAMWGIEQCRLACGGHGFSMASGIQKIYGITTPACTYEGENTVMMLQTARFLMKSFDAGKKGSVLTGQAKYLSEKPATRSSITQDCNLDDLVAAYRARAYSIVSKCSQRLQQLVAGGKAFHDAWNLTSVDLVAAATAHCHYNVVKMFVDTVQHQSVPRSLRCVLSQLCQLYATFGIVENAGEFVQGAHLTADQVQAVRERMFDLLAAIRPNAVAIVDAFDFPDQQLQSCLGRYDGNVYESLYEWAKQSPLNKTEVHESFHKYLKPMLRGLDAKL